MKKLNNKTSKKARISTQKQLIDSFEAATKASDEQYVLKLYITGTTTQSQRALANIKKICDENLEGRYKLEVIDIYQEPKLAKDVQILAAPTLIKSLPLPLRRFIGDLSDEDRVLVGLALHPKRNE